MTDEPLLPASDEDIARTLAYGLTHTPAGKPHRQAIDFMARIAAETLVQHLRLSGFVLMRRPPGKPHSTSG